MDKRTKNYDFEKDVEETCQAKETSRIASPTVSDENEREDYFPQHHDWEKLRSELIRSKNQSCDSGSYTDRKSPEIFQFRRPRSPGHRRCVTRNQLVRSSTQMSISKSVPDLDTHDALVPHPRTPINNFDLPSSSASPPINYSAQGARPKIRPTISRQSSFSLNSRVTPSMGSNETMSDIEECHYRPSLAPQMTKFEKISKFMSSCQPNIKE